MIRRAIHVFSTSVVFLFLIAFLSFTNATTQTDQPNTIKILVLGDSLSAAYKLSIDDGWVSLIQTELNNMGIKAEIINASVSGITTTTGLQILPSLLKENAPHIVVLELGANDGLQGRPIKMITQNLNSLIGLAKQASAEVMILGVRLPPNRGKRYTEPFFDLFQSLAEQNKTEIVPFFLEGVAGNSDMMLTDGLHPNKQGQKRIVENVLPKLIAMLESKFLNK